MSNEKYYDYYLVNKEASAEALKIHTEKFNGMRKAAHEELLESTGAIAWRESSNWGKPNSICELVYPRDHAVGNMPHVKVCSIDFYEDRRVICVRGKGNSKAGKAFNEPMALANGKLSKCLTFQDWIIHEHFKVSRSGLGGAHSSGRGTSMISTYGGMCDSEEHIVMAVPNDSQSSKTPLVTPDSFEAISYGRFYDLVNGAGANNVDS